MTVAVLIVAICVTAYFMSVQREAKYRHAIVSLVEERDSILKGMPGEQSDAATQVLILRRG